MKTALLLYPNQLFPLSELPQADTVVMVEEPLFFGTDQELPLKIHKQKLILHRASMRRYVEEVLWPAKIEVEYIGLDVLYTSSDIFDRTKKFDRLCVIDPLNETLIHRLLEARRINPKAAEIEFVQSPNFYLQDAEIREYMHEKHERPFVDFYQWQRERFNVLIDDNYKPVGGDWCLEPTDQGRLPDDLVPPSFQVYGDNPFVEEAKQFVGENFASNPGSSDFIWPTNHREAESWLDEFINSRLEHFAKYKFALDDQAAWLYHSAIETCLNIGLLNPKQVLNAVLAYLNKHEEVLMSAESFVRIILGQREYFRGLYITQQNKLKQSNPFRSQRKLTDAWYKGDLGLPPFDNVVKKIHNHGYAHTNERLMVVGNLMLLAEIHPDEVYRWFSELLIDSYEWASVPFAYGLIEFASPDLAGDPKISSSQYILQMSNYERGQWADVWDGLFWRFVDKHHALLSRHKSTRHLVQRLNRLDSDHRRVIGYRAEDFLSRYTIL